jgi:hypothetical protein
MKKLAFILFLYINIYSQEFSILYQNELPSNLIEQQSYFVQISNVLAYRALLNPDLIYYYIEYLNTDSIENEKKQLFYALSGKMNNDQNNLRNEWIYTQVKKISFTNYNERVKETSSRFFTSYIEKRKVSDINVTGEIITDKNKKDYYVCKYYLNDYSLVYSPDKDYVSLRNACEKQILSELQSDNISNKTDDKAFNFIKYWYLFTEDKILTDSREEAYIGVLKLFNEDHTIKRSKVVYVSAGYSLWNYTFDAKNDFNISEISNVLSYTKNISPGQFSIGGGFQFIIREHHSIMSHIKIEANYFTSTGEMEITEKLSYNDVTTYNAQRVTRNAVLEFKEQIQSFSTLRLDVSAPLLFLTNDLYFEVCLSANYNIMPYKINYNYQYYYKSEQATMWGDWFVSEVRRGTNKSDDTGTKKEIFFLPSITLMYNLPLNLYIKLNSSYNTATLNISYGLEL